jgi:hypothetical protein
VGAESNDALGRFSLGQKKKKLVREKEHRAGLVFMENVRVHSLKDLTDALRSTFSRSVRFSVAVESAEVLCTADRPKRRLTVNKATGACTLGKISLPIVLDAESVAELAGKQEFRVGGRPKRPLPESTASAILHTFTTPGDTLGTIVTGAQVESECFFLESSLKHHRLTYEQDKRVLVGKRKKPEVLVALKRLELVGMTAPCAFVVEKSALITKPQ